MNALQRSLEEAAPMLRRLARRLTGNAQEAEDLFADTVAKVLAKGDTFDGRASFGGWAGSVMHNAWRDRLRSARWRLEVQGEPELLERRPTDGGIRAVEERLALDQLLERVAPCPLTREMVLHAAEGYTLPEIAQAMGMSPTCVKSRIARVRAKAAELAAA